jgi:hypothetical protein
MPRSKSGKKPQAAAAPQRRFMLRYPTSSGAAVVRDTDTMRCGVEASLKNVSLTGIGLTMEIELAINEQVQIRVRNEIQRIEKEVRGIVRHVTPRDGAGYYVGIELYSRLTPLEVGLLRMGLARDLSAGALWL